MSGKIDKTALAIQIATAVAAIFDHEFRGPTSTFGDLNGASPLTQFYLRALGRSQRPRHPRTARRRA